MPFKHLILQGIDMKRLVQLIFLAGFALGITTAFAADYYTAVAEWDGREYHPINGSGTYEYHAIGVPLGGLLSGVNGVAVWYDGIGLDYHTYVIDGDLDRVRFFETNISRSQETLTWNTSPGVGQFSSTQAIVNNTAGDVVRGSERITVNGSVFTRVNDISGFDAGDRVYEATYEGADAANSGIFDFPTNSLREMDTVVIEYATTDNYNNYREGDIDFAKASATPVNWPSANAPFWIDQSYPDNTGHPTSYSSLSALAVQQNITANDVVDVYLLDDGGAGNAALHAFKVEDDADTYFQWTSSYDGPMSNPLDVCVAQSGTNSLGTPTVTTNIAGGGLASATATVTNAALNNNQTYTWTVIGGAMGAPGTNMDNVVFRIDNDTVGNTIGFATLSGGGPVYTIAERMPGIELTLTANGATQLGLNDYIQISFNSANESFIAEYIFIADTGNDRIKVIKGGDNGEATTNGDSTDFFQDNVARKDYFNVIPVGGDIPNQMYVSAARAMEDGFAVYTDTDGLWSNSLSGASGPADLHYSYNYDTQVLQFGDGSNGKIPQVGDSIYAVYKVSLDVVDYGSNGSGTGNFDEPAGVSARWNSARGWYDLYVTDRANNRIVKLRFNPEGATVSSKVQWAATRTTLYQGSTLTTPNDIEVIEASGGEVYVIVCDTGNDRVAVFRDYAAEAGGTGSDSLTYVTSFGGNGTEMGEFENPSDISAITNGSAIDIYVADASRDKITKLEFGENVAVSLDYSNISSYGYPTTGAYTFTKNSSNTYMTENAPSDSYLQFFYSDTTSSGPTNAVKCSNTQFSPETTSFTWELQSTPSGVPANGVYYLYARLFNADGLLIAEHRSPASDLFEVNSNLAKGLGALDAMDGDIYISLQNNSVRQINLSVIYPDSVGSVGFSGTFPEDSVRIVSIEEGPGWQAIQNQGTVFEAIWDSTGGTFEVSTSVMGSNTGLVSGQPAYTLAVITIQANSDILSSSNRSASALFTLDNDCSWSDYRGNDLGVPTKYFSYLRFAYLGDIASASGGNGTVPNLILNPDGIFGIDDVLSLTMAWNGYGGTRDPIADLGPYTGTLPNIAASPDGELNVDDLMAFTLMFNWYRENVVGASKQSAFFVDLTEERDSDYIEVELEETDTETIVHVLLDDVSDLLASNIHLQADPQVYQASAVENTDLFVTQSNFYRSYLEYDGADVFMSRMNSASPGFSGSGEMLTFVLDKIDQGRSAPVYVHYDLRSDQGEVIEKGVMQLGEAAPETLLPTEFKVSRAYPNPFNPTTSVDIDIPDAGIVELAVYNILGQQVFADQKHYQAGTHTFAFDASSGGSEIAAGVYFLKLAFEDKREIQKIILLK